MSFKVILPNRSGQWEKEVVNVENNIVLVGANGAGKTRLAVWIEEQMSEEIMIHRISAQKVLNIPDYIKSENHREAQEKLFFGRLLDKAWPSYNKQHYRYRSEPNTHLLNDFDELLSLLFAEKVRRDAAYTQQAKDSEAKNLVPEDFIDILVKVRKELLPDRMIFFEDWKVLVRNVKGEQYNGKEMSDGERVMLYLIGQCLCVPYKSIIIIDEPELHLHKSIISKLWDKIEELCPNKFLIYITHDLDFAASREDSLKLWIKDYNGGESWEWEEIAKEENFPESLLFEIIGSRKSVIFCEGVKGGLDEKIYTLIYPDFYIVPRGSCEQVIESTKAFNNNQSLHHLKAFGIIDSDYKEEEEKASLCSKWIHTLPVAEIENLLCIEPVLRIVAEYLKKDSDEVVTEVVNYIIKSIKNEHDVQVSSKAKKMIEYKLHTYLKKSENKDELANALREIISNINISEIYNECDVIFNTAIKSGNLEQLLLIYNNKGILAIVANIFKMKKLDYINNLMMILKDPKFIEFTVQLRGYLPIP